MSRRLPDAELAALMEGLNPDQRDRLIRALARLLMEQEQEEVTLRELRRFTR
ncbi:MAG: hypothetical protein H6739_34860 [Alphaproteobacteria bacterium]|nr:hypothetical protein [Alphaproteobacteria bacterium]